MMNLLDPDIPLEYLIPTDLPYAESYEQGILNISHTTCESLGLKMKALVQGSIMLRTKYQNWYILDSLDIPD